MRALLAGVNWKAFAVLLVAGLPGVVAVIPYMVELLGSGLFGQAAAPDVPMPLVVTLAVLQNGIRPPAGTGDVRADTSPWIRRTTAPAHTGCRRSVPWPGHAYG